MNTIGSLLNQAGCQFRIYEMGRLVSPIDSRVFDDFEHTKCAYPAAVQSHARFAVAFWTKDNREQPFIWMLQFPLDEQSFLVSQARDKFLALASAALNAPSNEMPENPYVFKPVPEKLAYLNSRLKRDLNLNYSTYLEPTQAYFKDQSSPDTWQSLAMQGIADYVTQLDREDNSDVLAQRIASLNPGLLRPLLALLEHQTIDAKLAQVLLKQHQLCLNSQVEDASLWLRATASCQHSKIRHKQLEKQISTHIDEQSAIDIAGRLWQDLEQPALLNDFLIAVAKLENARLFRELFVDLAAIPSLRSFVLVHLRVPPSDPNLSQAISQLLSPENIQHDS
ncbi:DUF3549 family protein [Alginatibacterium sediminis]|uniref:DUF3549 family protein n=1 Tax=Alginatibacterium sediminis TaxID=2164068 RepID=A0A420EBP1_9ALTE|nr:DUF3549 family protein [Alginatibacterium sediminis]RKF18117.1 DUF3549 family protein [Alginatibacterium sediminis]